MRNVLVLCPQDRDRKAVSAAALDSRYRIRFVGEDLDRLDRFEPEAFLTEAGRLEADGVVATKDQSALVAAILAERLGLPGPSPGALLACQHKPTSREIQRRVAPEFTPRTALVGAPISFGPPFFVKPVVGRLSQGAAQVDRLEDASTPSLDAYADRYASIAALAGADPAALHGLLVEEVLHGAEVTLEGYVHRGQVTVVGITGSAMYPGTISFERFEYPSALPEERRAELGDLAERLALAHGLDDTFFNIEFFVPEEGPPGIVEVNGRIASQFAPLTLAVHGRSTYDALFDLACGVDPGWNSASADGVAVSYVLRVFEDAFVEAVPHPEDDLEVLVRPGLPLSQQGTNDIGSYRLAILYGAAETREQAVARCRERAAALSFRLRPLEQAQA